MHVGQQHYAKNFGTKRPSAVDLRIGRRIFVVHEVWSLVSYFITPCLNKGHPPKSPEMATNFSKDKQVKQVPKIWWASNSISCHRTTNKLLRKVAEILPNQLATGGSSSPTCATLQLGLNPMVLRSWISTENLEMDVELSGKSFMNGNTTMAFLASKTCDELTTE